MANAVILDQQVGDIGMAVFCERDIGGVKEIGNSGTPNSLSDKKNTEDDSAYLLEQLTRTGVVPEF